MEKSKTQGTKNKVEIIKDLIDMNNDGKITDDLPKILAFLTGIRAFISRMGGSKTNKIISKK